MEAVATHQQVPNEEAAVEIIGAQEDRTVNQQTTVGYRNPRKRRAKDNIIRRAPNGRRFEKRRRVQTKCKNDIRNRSLKQQQRLENKKRHNNRNVNKALRRTIGLEVVRLSVGSSSRIRKLSVKTLWRSRTPPKF
jgi:hypothetical protein